MKSSLAHTGFEEVVTEYLDAAGLTPPYLDQLAGFNLVGYGCTTCIGNSGPLPDEVSAVIREKNLVVCSVLSGNRNFEGRIQQEVRANYLASPPLVVAYALAGWMHEGSDDRDRSARTRGRQSGVPQGHLANRGGTPADDAPRGERAEMFLAAAMRTSSRATSAGRTCDVPEGSRFVWDQ